MSSATESMPGNLSDEARAVGSAPVEQVCEDEVENNADGEQDSVCDHSLYSLWKGWHSKHLRCFYHVVDV